MENTNDDNMIVKETEINESYNKLEEKEEEIKELKFIIDYRDREIDDLHKAINILYKKIEKKDEEIKELNFITEYRDQEINDLENTINNSSSVFYMMSLHTKINKLTKLTHSLLKAQKDFVYSYRY
jgi:predicted RNase H-like nuclease (RuvC/YqgF family)